MRKYNALLIHQQHDDDGIVEVVESHGVRALHFGSRSRQSCMALAAPDILVLSYCRAMMSWQLFLDDFDGALLIGLGGGSLAKYLLRHFPRGRIDAIEMRPSVVQVARDYFRLPDDPRLKIHIGDGGEHIRQAARHGWKRYDLLLIDAYDHDAMSTSVDGLAFFDACRELLRPQGIMAINLWGANNPDFERTAAHIGRSFDEKVLYVPVNNRDNIIALGFSPAIPIPSLQQLRRKAEFMETQTQIEFPVFLKDLKKYNADSLKKVMQ